MCIFVYLITSRLVLETKFKVLINNCIVYFNMLLNSFIIELIKSEKKIKTILWIKFGMLLFDNNNNNKIFDYRYLNDSVIHSTLPGVRGISSYNIWTNVLNKNYFLRPSKIYWIPLELSLFVYFLGKQMLIVYTKRQKNVK